MSPWAQDGGRLAPTSLMVALWALMPPTPQSKETVAVLSP